MDYGLITVKYTPYKGVSFFWMSRFKNIYKLILSLCKVEIVMNQNWILQTNIIVGSAVTKLKQNPLNFGNQTH
jgi:hypothetical protein